MSHSSAIFSRVPVKLPGRSGFNLDHENIFTATCGTLTPAYCKPLIPKDTVSMGVDFQVQLPPMVTDFYGKIDAVFEAFFVPDRILWGGHEDFVTHPTANPIYPEGTNLRAKPNRRPTLNIGASPIDDFRAGTLADYLGFKLADGVRPPTVTAGFNLLPFVAYHMIYHHWYRDSRIQAPVFIPRETSFGGSAALPAYLPYESVQSTTNLNGPTYATSALMGDGVALGSLRQRNWSQGYFTAASPYPQAGEASNLDFDVSLTTGEGAISVAALRNANSLQQWMERNNFSYEYADQIYAQYGIYPDAAKMNKPIYLGRVRKPVYTRSVFQTSHSEEDSGINQQVGSKKGSSQSLGEGRLFENFTASEHGYLFVMFSLVPHAYYATGISRHLLETESEDIPYPLLAGMGDQELLQVELSPVTGGDSSAVFGYIDRYAHYKYDEDEVHGLLRPDETLENYALSRAFFDGAELGSEFLEIPTTALDNVMAVNTSGQGFSCWVDSFFKMTKISTLPAYSVPTLANLDAAQPTYTGYLSRGGSKL